jgi:hypothetical protein
MAFEDNELDEQIITCLEEYAEKVIALWQKERAGQ